MRHNARVGPDALRAVHERLAALIAEHLGDFAERVGYPPDDNHVAVAEDADALSGELGSRLPGEVVAFFRYFDRIHLPDFWNGYFIGPASWVVEVHRAEAPRWVRIGWTRAEVAIVGCDGGGTSFAVPLVSGTPVMRLPQSGIEDGTWEPWPGQDLDSITIATDFDDFVLRFVDGIERLVRHDEPGPFDG